MLLFFSKGINIFYELAEGGTLEEKVEGNDLDLYEIVRFLQRFNSQFNHIGWYFLTKFVEL